MKIHREGWWIIITCTVLLILSNLALFQLFPEATFLKRISFIISTLIFTFVVYFFRVPWYQVKEIENQNVISPASGKVVVIEEVDEPEYFNDRRIQVSIFMSPANVHVNRSPIAGIVKYLKYHPGNYLVAWHPKSSTLNERFTTVIENDEFEILVRQIAGKVARKISNYLDEGEKIVHGMELGFIKFGSRVDLFLPLDAKINVKLNQKVVVGKTVIAEYNK